MMQVPIHNMLYDRMADKLAEIFDRQLGLKPRIAGRTAVGVGIKFASGFSARDAACAQQDKPVLLDYESAQVRIRASPKKPFRVYATMGSGRDANKLESIRFSHMRVNDIEKSLGPLRRDRFYTEHMPEQVHCLVMQTMKLSTKKWKQQFKARPIHTDMASSELWSIYFGLRPHNYEVSVVMNEEEVLEVLVQRVHRPKPRPRPRAKSQL